jgi:hypothetical protein
MEYLLKMNKTYSKESQDIFVSKLVREPGFYLDIGSAEPIDGNNSYLLELNGWNGISLDQNNFSHEFAQLRKNKFIAFDVSRLDWVKFLRDNDVPRIIDYISLDVDDANISVINNFPFDLYEFKIMTFETDKYINENRKIACKNKLEKYPQYQILLEDAQVTDKNLEWEDWWINTNYFASEILEIKSKNILWNKFIKKLETINYV